MRVSNIPIDELKPFTKNPKKHPEKQLRMLKKSMQEFGWTNPILVAEDNMVVAGHARLQAATELGFTEVPVIKLDLPYEKAVAYVIADNRLAELAETDTELLASLLQEVVDIPDFDIEAVGFEMQDIDEMMEELNPKEIIEDDVPEVPEEAVTVRGDIWVLGRHRLMCGDSTSKEDVERLMNGDKADMVFTDPPYGMKYGGGRTDKFDMIIGDDVDPTQFYRCIPRVSEMYIWGRVENWQHLHDKPRDVIVWKKNNFGLGKGYRGQYEVCFYFGDFNGSDSDVWEVDKDIKYVHPTQKPVELCARAIRNSNPHVVLDLFGGSGSTLIACEQTNRTCYMMELDPHYCDVIIQRYVNLTGNTNLIRNGEPYTWQAVNQ